MSIESQYTTSLSIAMAVFIRSVNVCEIVTVERSVTLTSTFELDNMKSVQSKYHNQCFQSVKNKIAISLLTSDIFNLWQFRKRLIPLNKTTNLIT